MSVVLGTGSERVQALRQASLRVKRGTLHMLLGPNGCGKVLPARALACPTGADTPPSRQSTLLRVCGGLLRPEGGRLRVAAPRAFVFQNPDHQVVMPSAGADVAFGLGRLGLPPSEVAARVEAALAAVGLQVRAPSRCTLCECVLKRRPAGLRLAAGAHAQRRAEAARCDCWGARRAASGAARARERTACRLVVPCRCCCWTS